MYIEYGDIEYIVQNVPHDTILREESPKITFVMFDGKDEIYNVDKS